MLNTGEYYAKIYLVGLCAYTGAGYFTRIIEICGYGGEARVTVISNTAYGPGSAPTVVVAAPDNNTVTLTLTFASNYRCVATMETIYGKDMYISSVSGSNA